jgi:hypothetical protein
MANLILSVHAENQITSRGIDRDLVITVLESIEEVLLPEYRVIIGQHSHGYIVAHIKDCVIVTVYIRRLKQIRQDILSGFYYTGEKL